MALIGTRGLATMEGVLVEINSAACMEITSSPLRLLLNHGLCCLGRRCLRAATVHEGGLQERQADLRVGLAHRRA